MNQINLALSGVSLYKINDLQMLYARYFIATYLAIEAFREIAKETGLVTEEKPEQTLRFIHLTLCEFLAAYEAVQGQQNGWDRLISQHTLFQMDSKPFVRSRLVEVIPFACGLLRPVERLKAITDIFALNDSGLLARCFLETKAYNHVNWNNFVNTQANALLEIRQPNDEWLINLHLFTMVVRDSVLCSEYMSDVNSDFNPDHFYSRLTVLHKENLQYLLSLYAKQDAAAAFRLAESSNFNIARDFPEIIIKHCDQRAFVTLVIDKLSSDHKNYYLWSALLSEAALRSRVVAEILLETDVIQEYLNQHTIQIDSIGWINSGILKPSLYLQCLDLAFTRKNELPECVNLLKIIMNRLPAPESFRNQRLLSKLSSLIFILFFALALAVALAIEIIYASKIEIDIQNHTNHSIYIKIAKAFFTSLIISSELFIIKYSIILKTYVFFLNIGKKIFYKF